MLGRSKQQKNPPSLPDEVFPFIDLDAIRRKLRLEARGLENGRAGYPDSNASDFDPVEREIIAAAEAVRQQGLKEAAEHFRVYSDRIAAGSSIGPGIQSIINDTEGNFRREVDEWRGRLNDTLADFHKSEADLEGFKQENNLNRTAHKIGGMWKWAAICSVIILLESALNGMFFAEANVAGLAGGIVIALTISVVNVGMISLAGHLYRDKNHVSSWRKIIGWLSIIAGALIAVFINFLVGHFRDLTATVPWQEAAGPAFERVTAGYAQMQSLDAYLLTGLGILIAAFAGWKAYGALDPYPGYSRVSDNYEDKREDWRKLREEAFDAVIRTRDEAAAALKDEYDNIRGRFDAATAAREGFLALSSRRRDFLRECDRVTSDLLAIYRDANRRARATAEPAYFQRSFESFTEEGAAEPARLNPETMQRSADLVEKAVESIHETCRNAMDSFGDDRGSSR